MPNLENCLTYPELDSRSQEHKNTGIPREAHCNATVDCTTSAKRVFRHSCGKGAPAIDPQSHQQPVEERHRGCDYRQVDEVVAED